MGRKVKELAPWPSMKTWKASLYLEAKSTKHQDDSSLLVSLDIEGIITLFVYEYLSRPRQIQVTVIENNEKENSFENVLLDKAIPLQIISSHGECPAESRLAKLPAIALVDDDGARTVISGLCSVCRTIVSLSGREEILGFKKSCLSAPAEASVWTKFCEIDALRFLERFLSDDAVEVKKLDVELARFEMHLKQPVRIHNFAKVVQDMKKEDEENHLERKKSDKLLIRHQFVEGPRLFLPDLILFCVYYFVFRRVQKADLMEAMPLTIKWYEAMEDVAGTEALDRISEKMDIPPLLLLPDIELPSTEWVSLYKSDPKRYKPRKRVFTRQGDIESALEKIQLIPVDMTNYNPLTPGKRLAIDWTDAFGMPELGDLPETRLDRKQEQLKSVAQEVIHLARPGHVIVDFCSGSGHLGLLVASLLPNCQIVLLENKAESLQRAKDRAKSLNLSNVLFLQTNLDYFCGRFDIGVSLHACGVATDIVMELCIQKRAHFVCCPCCYGAVLNMPHITYPRSHFFRQPIKRANNDDDDGDALTRLTTGDYFCIAHGSDQSHSEAIANTLKAKCDQGQVCMDVIDYDRRMYAEENGYRVIATKLEPITCTQKNRLLIGECVE